MASSLHSLRAGVAAVRTALLDSAAGVSSPTLEAAAAALARSLSEHQLQLQDASRKADSLPAELRLELQQLGTEIQQLAEWNTRLAAAGQRALVLLLPEAARPGYNQLGGRASPFSGNAGGGFLKA